MRSLIHSSAALLLALLTLATCAWAQQQPQPQPPQTQQQPSGDGARRITPAEAREALARNEAVIVDVRGPGAYAEGHVKGALSIPYAEVLSRTGELPRDKMIITYCS